MLRAPSATPAVPVRSRKTRCTKGNDGEPLHPEGLSLASGLRGKVCLFFFWCFILDALDFAHPHFASHL